MEKEYLEREINKSYKNKAILFGVISILLFIFIYFGLLAQNVSSLFNKVKVVNEVTDLKEGDIVELTVSYLYDSGYDHTYDNAVTGVYGIANLQDGYLIVLVNNSDKKLIGSENVKIKGKVEKLVSYEKTMVDKIVNDLKSDEEEYNLNDIRNSFSEFRVDHGSAYVGSMVLNYIFVVGLAFVVYKTVSAILVVMNYKKSKVYKTMEKFGNAASVENAINNDVKSGKALFLNKRSVVSDSGVFIFNGGTNFYHPQEKLVWVYKVITQHRTNGIPSGKTHSVKFLFNDKMTQDVATKNENVSDELIDKVREKYPEIIYGFSDELSKIYNKNIEEFNQRIKDNKN